ncbi:signal transducing adapter molecule 2-like isoform X2 [Anneissia japonica]|nr:signal transducing adapter molecule 2-like isoform X2 [Anneissia japonica]
MDICDKVSATPNCSKDAMRSILKRLRHPVPHVAMQSLTVLGALVNNCGKQFKIEAASREFCSEAKNIIMKGHPKLGEKLKLMIKDWAEEFKSDPQLSLIPALYQELKQAGHDFAPDKQPARSAPISTNPDVVSSQQEEDDIAKAIQLSLEGKGSSGVASSSLYPTTNIASVTATTQPRRESRKVKALYDFEAAEDNELTFKAGEFISVLDDSDVNWWKGENSRGLGLFPSNFVTADLTAETEADIKAREKKSVSFDEKVEVHAIEAAPVVVAIDESKMEETLTMLQNADPTEERPDPPEMLVSEETCNRMAPLIDQELERIDREHADLTGLNEKLVKAFDLYQKLMREAPVYGYALRTSVPGSYNAMPSQYSSLPLYMSQGAMMSGMPVGMPPPHMITSAQSGQAMTSGLPQVGPLPPAMNGHAHGLIPGLAQVPGMEHTGQMQYTSSPMQSGTFTHQSTSGPGMSVTGEMMPANQGGSTIALSMISHSSNQPSSLPSVAQMGAGSMNITSGPSSLPTMQTTGDLTAAYSNQGGIAASQMPPSYQSISPPTQQPVYTQPQHEFLL